MIFTHLTIENFGIYDGTHEFDLRPRKVDGKFLPVILFGGKNGAGKTTILEAIRLCLYGQLALGTRVRRVDYETHIMHRLHRSSSTSLPARSASVELVFDHVHAGVLSTYNAVRAWRVEGQTFHERVTIYKNSQVLREIAPEHWSDFLRDLIPPGVADLFFFDGEQVQALADDETETTALATAMNGLLNLDLVERLKSDLALYVRQQENRESSVLQRAADEAQNAHENIEAVYSARYQDRAGLRTQLDRVRKRLEDARQLLLKEGASFVERRTELELRQLEVERALEQTRAAIRDLVTGLMPFALAPTWNVRLKERLEEEAKAEQAWSTYEARVALATEVASRALDPAFQQEVAPRVTPQDWARIANELQALLKPGEFDNPSILHPVSTQGRVQLVEWVDKVLHDIPVQMRALAHQLEALESERSTLEQALRQIPDDAVANPLLEQFHILSEAKGSLQEQIRQADTEMGQIELQLAEADRQRKKAWQQLASAGDTDLRIERAAKVQVILDAYLEEITASKTQELEKMVAHFFNLLCRKDLLVREVQIDPKRHTVILYSDNRLELPKSSLSAGERQLYAMSLLWALRSVSGRMLPIIIDTPMGRLDSDHRRTLLTEFFPNAAHQIILLSTDTEINVEAYELLKPAISHTFMLQYDEEQGHTNVEHKYFVDSEEPAP